MMHCRSGTVAVWYGPGSAVHRFTLHPSGTRKQRRRAMSLNALIPMLSVADLERTMTFYCGKLGFRVNNTFGKPKPVWCMLERAKVRLMFNQPPGIVIYPEPKDRQIFYFYPDDIASLHTEWRDAGLAVSDLRVTFYCMKEFELRDPDGYWLWFGESTSEPPTVRE